jgi:hypothetical protein
MPRGFAVQTSNGHTTLRPTQSGNVFQTHRRARIGQDDIAELLHIGKLTRHNHRGGDTWPILGNSPIEPEARRFGSELRW